MSNTERPYRPILILGGWKRARTTIKTVIDNFHPVSNVRKDELLYPAHAVPNKYYRLYHPTYELYI